MIWKGAFFGYTSSSHNCADSLPLLQIRRPAFKMKSYTVFLLQFKFVCFHHYLLQLYPFINFRETEFAIHKLNTYSTLPYLQIISRFFVDRCSHDILCCTYFVDLRTYFSWRNRPFIFAEFIRFQFYMRNPRCAIALRGLPIKVSMFSKAHLTNSTDSLLVLWITATSFQISANSTQFTGFILSSTTVLSMIVIWCSLSNSKPISFLLSLSVT